MTIDNHDIEKIKLFRLHQSTEKLKLSSIKFSEGLYNDAVILSFLSLFNSIRFLLCENGDDSDNYDKIINLAKQYFTTTEWGSLNIPDILKDSRSYNQIIADAIGKQMTKQEAEKYYKNAESVLQTIQVNYNKKVI